MKFSQDSLIFLMTVSRNLILSIHLDNWFDERDKKIQCESVIKVVIRELAFGSEVPRVLSHLFRKVIPRVSTRLFKWVFVCVLNVFAAPGFQHAACLTSHLLGSRLCLELVVTTLDHTQTNTHVAEGWKMCQVS